ncbi:urease accessory protein UreD [Bifidobacterium biavatii]|uniref:Urease accessory protein UreD n=1 Tax=Bifidobacterium biavatii DSM 23969 TaxID=1437608 RepID=A0A086ZNA0_9BIFI|nr:urease accessory protein UreD [Bifidobacterium biavatii]KFI48000.1 urease accessory protein [Bifidobacterium biavatii DSM 23969]
MSSSTFRLSTAFRHGRTKIDDVYFEAPFKLMTPFTNGRHSDFIVMLASPGFLKGDEAHIELDFGPGTDSTIKTQSYEKVLDTADGSASRTIDLTVRGDAKAVFLPFPVIPFRNSSFENRTTAHIAAESTFVYADVVTCGRVGMDERWAMRRFANRLRVVVDEPVAVAAARDEQSSASTETDMLNTAATGAETAVAAAPAQVAPTVAIPDAGAHRRGRPPKIEPRTRLAFADRMLLEPASFDYTEMGMWRSFTHCGVLYAHVPEIDPAAGTTGDAIGTTETAPNPGTTAAGAAAAADMSPAAVAARVEQTRIAAEDALIDRIRSYADSIGFVGELGVSRAIDGVCLRVLTNRGDDAFDLIKAVADIVTNG